MCILNSICCNPKLASDWLKQSHLNWTNLQFVIRSHAQFLTSHKPTYTFWMVWVLNNLELLYIKNYLNLAKIFVLPLFKMATNQTECSSAVIKFLVAEKCKLCEIYRRMCDMYGDAYFTKKNVFFTSGLNIGLLLWARVKKTAHEMETHWLSSKVKVLGTAVSKEGQADSLLEHVITHYNWFPWKRCNYKQCIIFLRQKFTLFIEWPCIINT